jgi:hypothetical protein
MSSDVLADEERPEGAASQAKKGLREHRYLPPQGATQLLLIRDGESVPADPDVPFPMVDGHGDPELSVGGVSRQR